MGNGPQQTPVYTPEDLEFINRFRNERGKPPIDEFGLELTDKPIVVAPPQPPAVDVPAAVPEPLATELETFGAPKLLEPTKAQEQRTARRDFEKSFDDLVQANLQDLVLGGYRNVAQLKDLEFTDPTFQSQLKDYATQQALRQSQGDVSLMPRTALPGFETRSAAQLLGIVPVEAAPPFELQAPPGALGPPQTDKLEAPRVLRDPAGVARGVATALSPQSRIGEAEADMLSKERASQIKAALPTPEQYVQQRGLNLDIHKDIAERDRLLNLAKTDVLSGEDIATLEALQARTKDRSSRTILSDIQDYASYVGLKSALESYVDDPLVRRVQTGNQVTDYILSEIKELPELMRIPDPAEFRDVPLVGLVDPREGDPRFKRHSVGQETSDPGLGAALSRQYKSGFVPVLSQVQKDFLSASTPIVRQAYVDILPYQQQRGVKQRLEAAQRQPTFGGAPVALPVEPVSPFIEKPKPITVKEAQQKYAQALERAGVSDFYAADFFEDPEKYAQGWSWWNKSYPSGATVEGPISWGLRVVSAPANVSSRLVYENLRMTSPLRELESVLKIEEPTEEKRLRAGEDPLYINHPYLRAIAENRGMMEDFYDLYYYNDYKKTAYLAGSLGLAADILLSPYDPGISQTVKGAATAGRGVKAARAVGMPIRKSEVVDDFLRGFVDAVGDQVLAVDLMRLPKNATMLDPVEYGATRASSFIQGAAAYKFAANQARSIGKTPTKPNTHEDIMRAALEIMQVGDSGNRFIDEAIKRGPEWALATADDIGKEAGDVGKAYTKYQDDLAQYMLGKTDTLPDPKLTTRLVNRVIEEDPQFAKAIEEEIRLKREDERITSREYNPETDQIDIRGEPGEVFESKTVDEAKELIDAANQEIAKLKARNAEIIVERNRINDEAELVEAQIFDIRKELGEDLSGLVDPRKFDLDDPQRFDQDFDIRTLAGEPEVPTADPDAPENVVSLFGATPPRPVIADEDVPEGVISLFGRQASDIRDRERLPALRSELAKLEKKNNDLDLLIVENKKKRDANSREVKRIETQVIPGYERELEILTRRGKGGTQELRTRLGDPSDIRSLIPNFSIEEILAAAKSGKISNSLYMRMLEPLSYKVAQSGISNTLEASKILGAGWRNLRMITPALFIHKTNVRRLGELVGKSVIGVDLQRIASKSAIVHGLHKNLDFRLQPGPKSQVQNPKTGAYINLSEDEANTLEDITTILVNDGYLTGPEKAAIMYQLTPQTQRRRKGIFAPAVDNMLRSRIISRENLSRLMDANIERVAYSNRVGVETEVFDTATTATKRALAEPLESRHLTQRFLNTRFSKIMGLAKDASSWSKNYADGVPLNVVQELDTIRGKLSSMDVVLRRDLRLLVEDTELQKVYFDAEWLKDNTVTQSDALVALALGPMRTRTLPKTQKAMQNILSIITVSEQDVTLDIMDVFRRTSVQRSGIIDALSAEGFSKLNFISGRLTRFLSSMPSNMGTVNGAEDFVELLTSFRKGLNTLITDASNIRDPAAKVQLSAPKFGEITAAFYYIQQQQRIVDEGVSNIVRQWPGFDLLGITPAVITAARETIGDFGKLVAVTIKEIEAELSVAPPPRLRGLDPDQPNLRTGQQLEQESIAAQIDELKKLADGFGALTQQIESGKFIGDYLAKRVQAILNYKANPTSQQLEKTAFSSDWQDIINSFFPDELTANPLFQNIMNRIIDDLTTPVGAGQKGSSFDTEGARQRSLASATQLLIAHTQANENALEIIKANRLNSGNLNETLNALDILFDLVSTVTRGRIQGPKKSEKAVVGKFTTEVMLRELAGTSDTTDLISTLTKLTLGTPVSKELKDIVNKSQQVKQVRDAILDLFEKNTTLGYKVASRIDATLSWLTKMRYGAILGSRIAFHATNVATAPFLVWGTLGGRAAFESVANAKVATEILVHGLKPTGTKTTIFTPAGTQIAVTDPFGRSYTYQEIFDMALGTGAMRSQTGVLMSETQFAQILNDVRFMPQYKNFVTKGLDKLFEAGGVGAAVGAAIGAPSATLGAAAAGLGASVVPAGRSLIEAGKRLDPARLRQSGLGKFLTDMTEMEDQVFRLATVIGALKRGDDPSQALATGRRALLDYGDLTPQEKWAMSRWAMFYSFFRLNVENTLKVLFSNPKRFVNIMRAGQAAGKAGRIMTGTDMSYNTAELDFYKHHFLLSKPMINYVEGSDKTTHYEVLPGIPMLDAFATVAEIMANPVGASLETLRGFIDPTARALLGAEQGIVWRKDYVDPRDMYVLSDTSWGSWFFSVVVKEQPVGRPARAGEEAWQGQVWTLSPQALERYKYFKNNVVPFMTIPGVFQGDTLPLTLFVTGPDERLTGRRFGPGFPQTLDDPLGTARTAAGVTGMIKNYGGLPMTDQRRAQLREMERRLRALEKQRGSEAIKQLKSKRKRR